MVEIQTGRKCAGVAAALRAKDYKRKKLEPLKARVSQGVAKRVASRAGGGD